MIVHRSVVAALIGLLGCGVYGVWAQTDGEALLQATLVDYNGTSGDDHYTVAWVATESGTFIKSLRKQGPSWGSGEWNSHCREWNTQRAGSTALDGYTSTTARNYSGTNSPVVLTWDCRDASDVLMPDGNYKFWVQYAENSGQGPFTASGLLWTKGPGAANYSYPDQGSNIINMSVDWTPLTPPDIAAVVISGGNLLLGGRGPANAAYTVTTTTNLNVPVIQWTQVGSGTMNSGGNYHFSTPLDPVAPQRHYRLELP